MNSLTEKDIKEIKYIVADSETDGLFARDKRGRPVGHIAQLSYLGLTKDFEIKMAKNFFFMLDKMPIEASNVHKLTVEVLKELSRGLKFKDHVNEIHNDLNGKILVAHNTAFDGGFLNVEFSRQNLEYLNGQKEWINTYCTMEKMTPKCKLTRKDYKTGKTVPKWPRLTEALDYYHIDYNEVLLNAIDIFSETKGFHDSRFDCMGCYEIFKKLNE